MNTYKVIGMRCQGCVHGVETAVSKLEGVTKVNVNLLLNSMQVEGDVSPEAVIKAVEDAGFKASLNNEDTGNSSETSENEADAKQVLENSPSEPEEVSVLTKMIRRLISSVILLIVLLYFSVGRKIFSIPLPEFFRANQVLLYIIEMLLSLAVIIINREFFISGFKGLFHGKPNMDTLVSLGSLTAFLYSAVVSVMYLFYYGNMTEYVGDSEIYFESSAMILTLISIGKILEERAKGKTTNAIKDLSDLSPKTALILTKDGEKEVPINEVKIGDTFILKPGMSVPVDGIIESGTSAINESSLTGESLPVDKEPGMTVSAATINMSGFLTCKATSVGKDTTFSRIIEMVTDAAAGKAPIAKVADKVSGVFIPVVLGIAIITFVLWMINGTGVGFALSRAISVLIISCPCALGLATPVAIMVGNGVGARHGILFKTAEALEDTGRTQIVVLDKTGTLTTGSPKITDVISTQDDIEHNDLLLSIAYSLESKSEHPLAKAICDYARMRYLNPFETTNFSAVAGKGVKADININGEIRTIFGGNEAYIKSALLGYDSDDSEEEVEFENGFSRIIKGLVADGKTPLIFASDLGLLGIIAVADEVREGAKEAIDIFHKENLHVCMVTGDRLATAEAVGREVGISMDEVISEVLPEDKANIVEKLKETGKVAMVGDGINDAPALTVADTGIAIGAGTDVAIQAADVVLVQNNLVSAIDAIRLSKSTLRIIHQNLFWAFSYNIIGIPLAAGCYYKAFGWLLNPMFCAAAMSISSIFVITNALRLFGFRTTELKNISQPCQEEQ